MWGFMSTNHFLRFPMKNQARREMVESSLGWTRKEEPGDRLNGQLPFRIVRTRSASRE